MMPRDTNVLFAACVTDFATGNTRDFADLGFTRVWDPLA
jgi:hypothetical protein